MEPPADLEDAEHAMHRPPPLPPDAAAAAASGAPPATPSTGNTYSPASSQAAVRSPPTSTTPFTPVAAHPPAGAAQAAPPTPTGDAPADTHTSSAIARQRSSIACLHCRKSKIRCVNNGVDSICTACRHAGRECRYANEMFKRSRVGDDDAASADRVSKRTKRRTDADGPLRVLRPDSGGGLDARMAGDRRDNEPNLVEEGILDPSLLTPRVWSELYTIFENNFGTDFPFLHSPTFSKHLREARDLHHHPSDTAYHERKVGDPGRRPSWEILALGILVLTARFHQQLVAAHCSGKDVSGGDLPPTHASDHYAAILRPMLQGSGGWDSDISNLAKVQALLMLGMYDWSTCRGGRAWIDVCIAIRMAQAMGLQFEDDTDFDPFGLSSATRIHPLYLEPDNAEASSEPLDPTTSRAFIEEEMRRRTFWSCFVMDRYLSSGKYRPSMLTLYDMRLQLPCSQNAFLFGERVCTDYLDGGCSKAAERLKAKAVDYRRWMQRNKGRTSERDDAREGPRSAGFRTETEMNLQVTCESGPNEGMLSLHVRMVDIWGRIAKWSCAGGMRSERYAPWHPSSEFNRMRDSLDRFQNVLPRLSRLSKTNVEAHIAQRSIEPYLMLQLLIACTKIALFRELVPFVPIRCSAPQGPMDRSQFPTEPPPPPGYYAECARQLFGAARDVLDLVEACHTRCAQPETPMAQFGLYAMVFVAVYAMHFPHMDPDRFVSGADSAPSAAVMKQVGMVLEYMAHLRKRLPMADNWFRTIHRLHRYYTKIAQEALASSKNGLAAAGLHVQHLPSPEQFQYLDAIFAQYGSSRDANVDAWTSMQSASASAKAPSLDTVPPPHHEYGPSAHTSAPPGEYGHRPTSSGQRHGAESTAPVASTPPHTIAQPPGLSRGSTPTPSVSSTSPYQGPSRIGLFDPNDTPQPPPMHQQLAHTVAGAPPSDWRGSSATSRHHALPPPPPTPTSGSTPLAAATTKHDTRASPLWLSDLNVALGGDDVAAFMDGLSCQEWAESLTAAHTTWSIKGAGWTGYTDGEERGWLGRVWRGATPRV